MITAARLEWADRALCAEVDPDRMFPAIGEDCRPALSLCRSCEVRIPCLEYGIETGDQEGIYGGFTGRPRRLIARRVRAGESLEDIIAADDAAFYAEAERASTAKERQREIDRRLRAENRAAVTLAAERSGQVAA